MAAGILVYDAERPAERRGGRPPGALAGFWHIFIRMGRKPSPIHHLVQLRQRVTECFELIKPVVQIEKAQLHVSAPLFRRETRPCPCDTGFLEAPLCQQPTIRRGGTLMRNTVIWLLPMEFGSVNILAHFLIWRCSRSGWLFLELLLLECIHTQVSTRAPFRTRDVP